MKIARFAAGDQVSFGLVSGLDEFDEPTDATSVAEVVGHPFAPPELTGRVFPLVDVRLLAPVLPSKIIAVAKNYADHAAEMGGQVPPEPMIFLKPSTSVIGPNDAIRLPRQSSQVEHEAELAVVVGRLCRDVPAAEAAGVVLGYTIADDVTARDLQRTDGQWGRAKGFDTFCPLGPWIDTDLDLDDTQVLLAVGDDVRQRDTTASWCSRWATRGLDLRGDDPAARRRDPHRDARGRRPLRAGDSVAISIDGIGTLTHQVVSRD